MNNPVANAIAQHFYEVHYGGNWTDAALKDALKDISFEQATHKAGNANTIALLLHHIDFYNRVVYDRCFGQQNEFKHEDSLHVQVDSDAGWLELQKRYFDTADKLHQFILTVKDEDLFIAKGKNRRTLYKNLHGVIEHIHYHLGQINLLKKIISSTR
jgi:hypothetical protein